MPEFSDNPFLDGLLARVTRPEVHALPRYQAPHFKRIIKLDANESPWPAPAPYVDAAGRIARDLHYHRYPDAACQELTAALAARHGVPPEGILVGNGSDELISLLALVFSANGTGQRGAILYPDPSFVMFTYATAGAGAPHAPMPLDGAWHMNPDTLARVCDEHRPALAFFPTPNNPTGSEFGWDLIKYALRRGDGLAVADEAYGDFAGVSYADRLATHPNLLVMRTFSKVGFAALRLGYLLGHPDVIRELDRLRAPYNNDSFAQAMGTAILANPKPLQTAIAEVIRERERLFPRLRAVPFLEVFPSRANFFLVRTRGVSAPALHAALLHDHGILVRCLDRPGPLAGCLRITVGTPGENDALILAFDRLAGTIATGGLDHHGQ